jgi:hypothetical protein
MTASPQLFSRAFVRRMSHPVRDRLRGECDRDHASALFSARFLAGRRARQLEAIYATLTLPADDCRAGVLLRALSLDQDMNATESEEATLAVAVITDVAEDIRDLLPPIAPFPAEQPSPFEPPGDAEPGPGSDRFASLIQNIAATPIVELERLIGELEQAKTYLQAEGERIEREAVGYVQLSQTALESVRIIAETVGEWRKAGHPVRGSGA